MKKLLCLLFLLLVSVAGAEEKAASWPPKGYAHVVGFCYAYGMDPRGHRIVFPDKTLHRGIIKATTVRFSKAQAERLVKILTTAPEEEQEELDCYDPHHGFVFYDQNWKVVGWFEVCFLCSGSIASSKAAPTPIDYPALEAFAREAGLPVFEDEKAYSELYQQENPPPVAGDKQAESPGKKKPDPEQDDPFAPTRRGA